MSSAFITSLIVASVIHVQGTSEQHVKIHLHPQTGAGWISQPLPQSLASRNWKHLACTRHKPWGDRVRRTELPIIDRSQAPELGLQFDARTRWPHCASISRIRDQGNCSSCWASAAVEVMSDRYCIATGSNETLSALDLLSCSDPQNDGCTVGDPRKAWEHWQNTGITREICRPYPFKACSHFYETKNYKNCTTKTEQTPQCTLRCDSMLVRHKLFKGDEIYELPSDDKTIMWAIQRDGPVEATFELYEDFPYYRSGIYFHAWGELLGHYSVRLLGWGSNDRGVPYWIAANSWNSEWGENGTVRILRANNECRISDSVIAGIYRV